MNYANFKPLPPFFLSHVTDHHMNENINPFEILRKGDRDNSIELSLCRETREVE